MPNWHIIKREMMFRRDTPDLEPIVTPCPHRDRESWCSKHHSWCYVHRFDCSLYSMKNEDAEKVRIHYANRLKRRSFIE